MAGEKEFTMRDIRRLKARISYSPCVEVYDPEGKTFDAECFIIETYDFDNKIWDVLCCVPLRNCAEHPDADEKEFIHYSFMCKILELVDAGYQISWRKEDDA